MQFATMDLLNFDRNIVPLNSFDAIFDKGTLDAMFPESKPAISL